MIKVDVFIKNKNWKKHISNPKKYLDKRVKDINSSFKIIKNKKAKFSILLSGNKEIRLLNKKFRNKNKSTDVLSFPFYKAEDIKKFKNRNIYLGDVILNYHKINKNNFKKNFNKLWIHGFLHLFGYKHHKDKDFYKMNKIEKILIKKIEKTKC